MVPKKTNISDNNKKKIPEPINTSEAAGVQSLMKDTMIYSTLHTGKVKEAGR